MAERRARAAVSYVEGWGSGGIGGGSAGGDWGRECASEGVLSLMCWVMGARASLPVAGGDAGGRRGCQSHVNLQFSCSFFLQGEGIPNGRLCKRARRFDGVDAAWESLDSAMCWDCGRRRKFIGCGGSESCS